MKISSRILLYGFMVLLCGGSFVFPSSDNQEAILKLDTKGHTGLIRDIIITKNKNIISASDDKTIRVWGRDGVEKRKILGDIGSGSEGKIFAIALSPNEKYLAVGGFINSGNNERIRIYNYKTAKLLKVLKSHENIVYDLSFSQDGKYLISGSSDKTAKIWKVSSNTNKKRFKLIDTIKFHNKQVYAVKIIKKKNKYFAITASYDEKIALYDMQNKRVIKSNKRNDDLQYLAINSKMKHIALSGDTKEIVIYDYNLNLIKVISSKTEPYGLSYSKDGRFLIAGSGTSPRNINIYQTKKNYSLKTSFKKHTSLTMAVGFLDKNTAISGGGDNNEIYIWNIKNAKVIKKIQGVGNPVWSVGIKGDEIAWGNAWTQRKGKSKLQKSINLKTFKINKKISTKNLTKFKKISTKNKNYSLIHSKGGDYGYSDGVLEIKYKSSLKAKIIKDSTNGFGNNVYGWYKDFIISGGSSGKLKIYNKEGEEIASLIGHTGEIWSIALDGDRLVSGSDDQNIKIWNLSSITNSSSSKKIYPTLNLFISSNNEYIAYYNEGFFTSSKKGAKYIGYHINQGANKEARYVSVDKFYDSFYRPDLIAKALKGKSLMAYAKDINIDNILNSGLAPIVAIKTSSHNSRKRDIKLSLEVCELNGGYDNLSLYLDGKAIEVINYDRALKLIRKTRQNKNRDKDCFNIDKLITLQNGTNNIMFKATNKAGNIESNEAMVKIRYKNQISKKPNLYILAIGIDKYRDGDLWLSYSKADAKAFIKSIKKASKPLFENIYSWSILDAKATKKNILKTFKEIGDKTSREDVFILYVAGHGITDTKTGSYFYLPVDFRYKSESSVRDYGFSQNDFKLGLSKIQAMKSLTLLDTCNSGSFTEAMASRGVLQKTAINKLTRATGRATIVASSKTQVALEGYKGHGVFTYTLMEALDGKGYGNDNKITILELANYVEDVLPDRTYEKWGYEQVPQKNISGNDFPIGVIR